MRAVVKHLIEHALIGSGITSLRRRRYRGRTLILAYHNVVPTGEPARGELSLHLDQRRFAEQLDVVGRLGDVVPLSAADGVHHGSKPRFIITFDDAYAGAVTAAVSELRRRGMPATIFVTPGLLGTTTWWDLLANRTTGLTSESERNYALSDLAGQGNAVVAWANAGRPDPLNADGLSRIATLDELRGAATYDGLTLGSHTWSHANLTAVSPSELVNQLETPAAWLRDRFADRYVSWLAYPYGLANPTVERAAADTGYAGAVRVDGGWIQSAEHDMRFRLPRFNVPRGLSKAGLMLRLSGIGAT